MARFGSRSRARASLGYSSESSQANREMRDNTFQEIEALHTREPVPHLHTRLRMCHSWGTFWCGCREEGGLFVRPPWFSHADSSHTGDTSVQNCAFHSRNFEPDPKIGS